MSFVSLSNKLLLRKAKLGSVSRVVRVPPSTTSALSSSVPRALVCFSSTRAATLASSSSEESHHSLSLDSTSSVRGGEDGLMAFGSRPLSPSQAIQQLETMTDLNAEQQIRLLAVVLRPRKLHLLERATQIQFTDSHCLIKLISAWIHHKQPNRAAELLIDWVQMQSEPPPMTCFRNVLLALKEKGEFASAFSVLTSMLEVPGLTPDRDCFHRVLQACTPSGELATALHCLKRMEEAGIPPVASTYKLILQLFVVSKSATALDTLNFFQKIPIAVDQVCYNIMLNALAMEGDYEAARDLYEQMQHQFPLPPNSKAPEDPIPVRTVLKAYWEANSLEAAQLAEDFLYKVEPMDARAYTTVVAIWCQQKKPVRARILLQELLSKYLQLHDPRLQPDPVSFRNVIGSLSQVDPPTEEIALQAQHLLVDMKNLLDYTPNLVTCNAVLKCWSQAGAPDRAQDFLEQMQQWGTYPDIVSYNTLLQGYAKRGNVDECISWLQRLAQGPLPPPNTRSFTSLIAALSKQGTRRAAEEAEGWLVQMQEWHDEHGWDCAPNQVTYNAVLQCWARAGDGPRAEYLLKKFEQFGGAEPNVASYNILLQAYGESVEKCESLLEAMKASGIQPNGSTVKTIQRVLGRDKSVKDPQAKWLEIRQKFLGPPPTNGNKRRKNGRANGGGHRR